MQHLQQLGYEPVMDSDDAKDQKTWKELRIDERRWIIVDGNNRQVGIKRAIANGNKLVPVCTRLIVYIQFTAHVRFKHLHRHSLTTAW